MTGTATDIVFIEGLRFYGYHGVTAAEQELGTRFLIDIELLTDLRAAGASDDLADTIDYGVVYTRVQEIVEGPPFRLIESVAEKIAQTLLAEFAPQQVVVTVRKPEAPVRGAMLSAGGIRIVRTRASQES